jgi:hypothetical protein
MPYVTNYQESPHNAWTLTKHVAKSLNKGAGKVDEFIYGKKTNVTVTTIQPPKPPKEKHPVGDVFFAIFAIICIFALIAAYATGHLKKRDLFTP